jgi:hypothetical protein
MKQIFAGPVGTCSTAIPTISFVIVGIGFLLAVIILIGWYILENKYKKEKYQINCH